MPLSIHIRPAAASDAANLSQLIADNARITLSPHYSAQQMEAFLDYYSPSAMLAKIDQQWLFCAECDGRLAGTVALDSAGFVVGFYTHVAYMGQGIGKALLRHIEDWAKQKGFREIQLTASPVGLEFYYKQGFEKVRDYVFQHLGVAFDETLMLKRL